MKTLNYMAAAAVATFVVVMMGACSSTNNGSSAATPSPTCSYNAAGQMVDQNGNPCAGAYGGYGCSGYQYVNGQYYQPGSGTPVNCGGTSNFIPSTGYTGGNYVSDCSQWQAYYGVQYVPVMMGGTEMCVQWSYLQQQYGSSYYSSYGPYANPSYWYTNPPTLYSGYYGGSGYGYGCQNNFSLGYADDSSAIGMSLCF